MQRCTHCNLNFTPDAFAAHRYQPPGDRPAVCINPQENRAFRAVSHGFYALAPAPSSP